MFGYCLILLEMLIQGTVKVRLGSYIVQKGYSWEFILLKVLTEDLAGYLFHWKDQNKGRLEMFLIEKAKMKYSFVPTCNCLNRGRGFINNNAIVT